MRMFDSVVIGASDETLDQALAIRGALELFRLRVHLYLLCQKRNLLDLLAGKIPEAEYVVLCCHGCSDPDGQGGWTDRVGLRFHGLVDEVQGKWEAVTAELPPEVIRQVVSLPGRTVIATGCRNGVEPVARAFLDAGCRAYMGAVDFVDQDSGPLFTIAFFYHLLRHETDPRVQYTDEEAARLAASLDTASQEGTHLFRYYSAEAPTP